MTKFYSNSATGFFDDGVHGSRKLCVPDPAWTRPKIDVKLQPGESFQALDGTVTTNEGDELLVLHGMADPRATPGTKLIDNPDCKIPADAVEISDELHAALLDGQTNGKLIVLGDDGLPALADRPLIPFAERAAGYMAEVRNTRETILSRLSGIAGRASRKGDTVLANAADVAALQLLDLTKAASVVAAELAEDLGALRAAVKKEYKTIAAAAPAALRDAFNGVDA